MSPVVDILIGVFIGIGLLLGVYLLVKSRDELVLSYQNWMLKTTKRPLKDEDFVGIKEKVWMIKVMALIIFGLSVYACIRLWLS